MSNKVEDSTISGVVETCWKESFVSFYEGRIQIGMMNFKSFTINLSVSVKKEKTLFLY